MSTSPDDSAPPTAIETPLPAESLVKPEPAIPPLARPTRMRFFAAYRYLFGNPEWVQTLLLGSVCLFVPVFGQIALLGYYYEIIERLHRDPSSRCPTFNIRRFATYATRGVWAWVLVLAVTSILQPVLQIPAQYTIFGIILAFQSDSTTGMIVATIAAVVWLLVLFGLFLVMVYVVQPFCLRGGLTQDLALMFRPGWVIRYSRSVWLELFLVQSLVFASMAVLFPFGLLLFFIGILPISIWVSIAASHLAWQVYEISLARGCEPIPLRPAEADVPPVAYAPMAQTISAPFGPKQDLHAADASDEQPSQPTSPSSSASP